MKVLNRFHWQLEDLLIPPIFQNWAHTNRIKQVELDRFFKLIPPFSPDLAATPVTSVSRIVGPQAPRVLTKKEIYREIGKTICQVETEYGKATAIFLGNNLIAVPYHVLKIEPVKQLSETEFEYKVHPIRCLYDGVCYTATHTISNLNASSHLDCALFQITDDDFPPQSSLSIFTGEIEPGEEVYFAGFPLTQTAPTFHSGSVSSVVEDGFCNFTVDGTVVPGNSGGPVFLVENGRLKLAGVIFHQIADFSPEDRETIAILNYLKTQPASGITRRISLDTPNGRLERSLNDLEVVILALDLIQRNLSTGIGRAFHAKLLLSLQKGENIPATSQMISMPVPRKDRIQRIYKGKDGKEYYLHCDGHESKHLKNSQNKKMSKRDFLESTKGGRPAMFYSGPAKEYSKLLEVAIRGWVDAGADNTKSYFKFKSPIGVDNGRETDTVEIYYGDKLGSHMRPKYLEDDDFKS